MNNTFVLHSQLVKDCIELIDFPLSRLLLCNDSAFPWFILVPRVSDVQDMYQLSWQDQQQLLNESSLLSELLMQEYSGDKMNVAALGNVVPQLHLHHIVRFKTDPCWPKPIWGEQALTPYTDSQLAAIKSRLMPKLSAILADQDKL
jgi:diadenosine tetraphosphate (Ap4A) HIT family hydrolase